MFIWDGVYPDAEKLEPVYTSGGSVLVAYLYSNQFKKRKHFVEQKKSNCGYEVFLRDLFTAY